VAVQHGGPGVAQQLGGLRVGRWTGVSFLIDRRGVVQFVHLSGQYAKGDEAYDRLRAKVEELLKEE